MNDKSRRLFACHVCESEEIRVSESQQMRQVEGTAPNFRRM